MRILHILHSLNMGGLERVVVSVANGLARRGLAQAVCCLHDRGCLIGQLDPNVELHLLDARPNDPTLPLKLARIYRSFQADVVETVDFCSWPDATVAALGRRRVRLAHTFHGFLAQPPRRHRLAGRFLGHCTHRLKSVSQQLAQQAAHTFHIPLERIEILPNGVDVNAFKPAESKTEPRSCLSGPRFTCLTVASIKPAKDPLLLVEVARQLGPNVHFIWVGDGVMRQEFALRARQAGVTEQFTFAGQVQDVRPYLASADLFVLPSRTEAAPISVLEAMAMGLPVVATRTGDLPLMVQDTGAGLLSDVADAAGLASSIDRLRGDSHLRESMARAARQAAVEQFSTQRMLDGIQNGYQQLCAGKPALTDAVLPLGGGLS